MLNRSTTRPCVDRSSGSGWRVVSPKTPTRAMTSVNARRPRRRTEVLGAAQWPFNLGSGWTGTLYGPTHPPSNGLSIPLAWARCLGADQHQRDDLVARAQELIGTILRLLAGDNAWSYESVLNIYRRLEDGKAPRDPTTV